MITWVVGGATVAQLACPKTDDVIDGDRVEASRGLLKLAWLSALNASARNCSLNRSVISKCFARLRSRFPIRLCPENISAHAVRTRSWKRRKDGTNQPPDDPGNPTANFHGEKRSNHTHESTTDSDALLARKGSGKEAKLSYNGNLLTENRNGLIVSTEVFPANGLGERAAATAMLEKIPGDHRVTVGVDKG